LQAAARPYERASGNPLGSVMVGIPEEQFLELNAKFPPRGFARQNPKVNEAIKESITEEEKTEIAEHLGIRHTRFTFEFKAARHFIDEANERPSSKAMAKSFGSLDCLSRCNQPRTVARISKRRSCSRLRASGPIPFHPGITAREPDLRLEKQELDTRKMGKDNQ
jgi:hypothetical protein